MLDKENRKAVEALNKKLGTRHRTKPYDFKNADDLKQALTLAVAAYRDYWHYVCVLTELESDYDESLENYDVASWLNLGGNKADALSAECADSLGAAWELFNSLAERAKEHCQQMIKTVLSTPPQTQKAVLGRAYKTDPKKVDAMIAELFDVLDEEEYFNPIPDNFRVFLKLLEEQWEAAEETGEE